MPIGNGFNTNALKIEGEQENTMIDLSSVALPIIVTIVYCLIDLIKTTLAPYQTVSEKISHFYPLIALALGVAVAAIMFYSVPESFSTTNLLVALAIGAASGLTAVGTNQVVKQLSKTATETAEPAEPTASTTPANIESNSNADKETAEVEPAEKPESSGEQDG